MRGIRGLSALLRVFCVAALSVGLGGVALATTVSMGKAGAAGYESLMVPSAAMGRDIPVAFLAGGPHAVYLLDAFNAAPDVSNWVTAGNAMNTLAGKGISVVAPAGGAYSMYTNWEQDGSKQWDTFLSSELPRLAGRQQGPGPRWPRRRRRLPGRLRRDGAGRASTPTASASPARCRASCTRRAPTTTARSSPACSSSAASTATECGAPRSWDGGSGTTRTCTPRCWPRTTPGSGSTARRIWGAMTPR